MVCSIAYTIGHSQISVSAKAGLNIAKITGKDVDGYKSKAGLHVGGIVNIPVQSGFSIQPELYFSSEGARWGGFDDSKTSLSYLRLPLLAKYTHSSGFFAETGPQLGILISAKDKEDKETTDVKEYLKKTEFSWALGAGYAFSERASGYVRYNFGLSSFYEEEKNSVFQIGLTYRLNNLIK